MQRLAQRPAWLKKSIVYNPAFAATEAILKEYGLHTVCRSARCPNILDCFSRKIATFLILGDACTRGCRFCAVSQGEPADVSADEPQHIAEAVIALGLDRVVVTSVTRDDLPDGGAGQFAKTIAAIRSKTGSDTSIETLVPDFKGDKEAISMVADAQPDIFGHNIETVPRLYGKIRPAADYKRSLYLLKVAKEAGAGMAVKSGMMAGLGETRAEVISVMADLRAAGCDRFTIGQYLRPSTRQAEVSRFVAPDEFLEFKKVGLEMGFERVESGPFVRSSYREKLEGS